MNQSYKESSLVWLALLFSLSTLLCCTLPIILISLGFGAVLASVIANFNFIIILTQYKFWLFIGSGLLLIITYWIFKRSEFSCPTDPVLAEKCRVLRRFNWRILKISVLIWLLGFVSAYILAPLFSLLGWG
jgi:mercuric ion transport protein